jgi:dihydrofolate synthase/folylpolyglutamate synthase
VTTDDRERAALAWLFSFADWERGVGWNPNAAPAEQWKLGRTRALLDLAGAPDRDLRIVHIAGTKGKGSTAAYLESIARAGGLRTGLYSQPHLHTYRERVKLAGRLISVEGFARQVDRLHDLVAQLGAAHPEAGDPTTFELTTVLAILAFAEAGVDLAVVEVGLGGRLDATNALHTNLSVITSIGLDHQQILGETLAEIAGEKAGIIRPRQPVISAIQRPAARRVIVERCHAVGSAVQFVERLPRSGRDGPGVVVKLSDATYRNVRLGVVDSQRLPPTAQRQNAAIAVAIGEQLRADGIDLRPDSFRTGLETAWLPARQEIVSTQPLLIVDAAHNVDSARALAEALDHLLPLDEPYWLVIGMLRDKDIWAVLRPLLPRVRGVVAAAPASPRALPADELATTCRALTDAPVEVSPSVAEALRRGRAQAGGEAAVVVAGSFVTAAEARVALGLADVLTSEDRAAWIAGGAPLRG